jgi:plasmid stability protein
MPSMQIRNVPPEVLATLRRRAHEAEQSLQAYLFAWLTEQASKPTIGELFDRTGERGGNRRVPLEYATKVVREERDARAG